MIGAMLSEAWMAMWANRLRTILTMLGMVIGVGAVILMLAIGQGTQQQVQHRRGGAQRIQERDDDPDQQRDDRAHQRECHGHAPRVC